MMSDVPAANVEARSTPEHDRAVVLERIQAAAQVVGAACDVHQECEVTARPYNPTLFGGGGPPRMHRTSGPVVTRVLVTGTYTEIERLRTLLPGDVLRRAQIDMDEASASMRWVL
jgi:hypothetical protein